MNQPRSLSDLPAWRQKLLNAPEGSLSRQYGERLRDLQESRASGHIDQTTFEGRANQIAEDLNYHENDLPHWHHHVANADVGLQYVRFSAQAVDAIGSAAGGPRARYWHILDARNAVQSAMRNGANADQAIAQGLATHAFTHEADIAAVRQHAEQLVSRGGPRAPEAVQTPSSQQAGVSWPQPQTSASTRSINQPRTLSDLPAWRQTLLNAPEGSLSRQYGERLRDLQESRASGHIDQTTFEGRANQIAEDLKDHENDLPYWDHHVANADVGLQYVRFSAQAVDAIGSAAGGPRARYWRILDARNAVQSAMRCVFQAIVAGRFRRT